jgi:hypothetical protein
MTLQEHLLQIIQKEYSQVVVKKMNKDHFLDLHIPSVNEVRGTHLFFNTAKNKIKLGFYCRDENFTAAVLAKSDLLELYSQGIRPKGNPEFTTAEDACIAAKYMLSMIATSHINNTPSTLVEKLKLDQEYESALFDLIKEHRILCNFSFIPDKLRGQGFDVDSKACFFFADNTFWADGDESWNLLIDINGFNSSQGGNQFRLLFDWDSLKDVKCKIDNDNNSIIIGLFQEDGGFLSIEQKGSQSLRVIHFLYQYIMKDITDKFAGESVIIWSVVQEMGITIKNFESFDEFYNLFE